MRLQSYLIGRGCLTLVGYPSNYGATIKIPVGYMFCYDNQPCIPSFPVGLFKTSSDFIVKAVFRLAKEDEHWW